MVVLSRGREPGSRMMVGSSHLSTWSWVLRKSSTGARSNNKSEGANIMGEGIVKDVDGQTFAAEVEKASGPVVVDFWAAWCGPCKMVGPVIEKLAEEHAGKVIVAKVDVDNNQELAARFGIMSIPTVVLFEDGKVKTQVVGARSQKDYEQEFGL